MKAFYKIENNLPILGSGTVIPEGFTEYEVGQEPTELANALILQQEQENKAKEIADKKAEKELRLSQIVVTTTNGNTFDGNETARNNMLSAITSAEFIGKLALSIQEVGRIVTE